MDIQKLQVPDSLLISKTVTFHYTANRSSYDDLTIDEIRTLEKTYTRLMEDINDLTENEVTIISTVTEIN